MEGLETGTVETQVTQPGAATETTATETTATETKADPTPEKVSALQKFIDGLFGGKKAEETKTDTTDPEKTSTDEVKTETGKSFNQDDVNAAIEAAKKQWQDEQAEQERLKKLSPEEREKEEQAKKDTRISELETKLIQRELKDTALTDLTNEGFPVKLAEILNYTDADSMKTSLKTVKEVFKDSLAAAINERLKGKTPEGLGGAARTENLIVDQIAKNIRGGMM